MPSVRSTSSLHELGELVQSPAVVLEPKGGKNKDHCRRVRLAKGRKKKKKKREKINMRNDKERIMYKEKKEISKKLLVNRALFFQTATVHMVHE